MKKILMLLVLTSSMAQAGLQCSGSNFNVSVNGNTLDVSGPVNFRTSVTKTVNFNEVYRGTVGRGGVRAVNLIVEFSGNATLELIKSGTNSAHSLTCVDR